MKKFVILLLVFSLLGLTSCGLLGKVGIGMPKGTTDICEIANNSKPTKVTTEVSYITNASDTLQGYYVTTTDGVDVIFEYYYEKLATPAESLESGNYDRIISSEGVINYRDGSYYSGDEELWKPGTGTAFDLKFNVKESLLKEIVLNEDGSSLEAKVTPENLKDMIGTDLNASGDATVSITTNGANLTGITVSCSTSTGNIVIRTSFTYNPQDLFPETDEEA